MIERFPAALWLVTGSRARTTWRRHVLFLAAVVLPALVCAADDIIEPSALRLRLQCAVAEKTVTLDAAEELMVHAGDRQIALPAGTYTFRLRGSAVPREQRFHLMTKTFQPGQEAEMEAYSAEWRAKGYAPEVVTVGRRLNLGGKVFDNRDLTVSVARVATQAEADALKKKLEQVPAWAWIRPEAISPGRGSVEIVNAQDERVAELQAPLALTSLMAVQVRDVDTGFWKSKISDHAFPTPLSLEIGAKANLELYGEWPLEQYLMGVLPAEMPPLWPAEAVKAQAVAARSDVLAHLGGKHRLEGFDFCVLECCRAYVGEQGRHPASDAAVRETEGEVLVAGGRVVPTVFSATCGGFTENNDTVWSAPPNAALRGVADLAQGAPASVPAYGIQKWISGRPAAWCAGDTQYFRWSRRLTAAEVTTLVNKQHKVGAVRRIELGDRGVSGRLNYVKVIGTEGSAVIRKELPIRLAFGGLPSAMFTVEVEGASQQPAAYVFHGAGRGHGVGLCQNGARGMAEAKMSYKAILLHYFSGASIEGSK
ncbi:MAG: SpoIID/LytB domain-containing protein [Candidatus Hydrogenedentes bacterium]|nr:SpoIID/LytB domain-containing protein [Candidatus Hydrogenedentota bacterium]